jgi:hypothetical protein
VPQIMLDRSGVLTVVGQLVAAAVAQHVAVDKKPELGRLAGPGNHALVAGDAERRPALRHEHVRAGCHRFPLQPPQCPAFLGSYWMHAGCPALGSTHVQSAGG